MDGTSATELRVIDLGRLAYVPALETQRRIHQEVLDGQAPSTLLLVEHDPVITVSQRQSAPKNLVASPQLLARLGIDVQPTDRGGDITYHGPGQLVAYPILRLAPLGLTVSRYMRLLEDIVIDTLAAFGIRGFREEGATGVWVKPGSGGGAGGDPAAASAKICAMGVRVRRNVAMHGLALNITTDLSHFATIIPCGLVGRPVTSMSQLLGPQTPTFDQVKAELVAAFHRHIQKCPPSHSSN